MHHLDNLNSFPALAFGMFITMARALGLTLFSMGGGGGGGIMGLQ